MQSTAAELANRWVRESIAQKEDEADVVQGDVVGHELQRLVD